MAENIQLQTSPSAAELDEQLERAMARHHYSGDALIEILHHAQELYGYLSPPLLNKIARSLKLPPSRVLGVATFYSLFRFHRRKPHCAVVCLGTACYEAGARDLLARAYSHAASDHNEWSIEVGRCVGSCGLAPVAILDGEPTARVTAEKLDSLLTS
jgi:bidirectional [NiFe] hydrogenase diaphorase subunit